MKKIILNLGLTAVSCAMLATAAAQAATATSPVINVILPVNTPACTVANSSPTINLTAALSAQTLGAYQAANWPTNGQSSVPGSWTYYTSSALNQSATITCTTPNTAITSIIVKNGPNANTTSTTTNQQYLTDTATPTPNILQSIIATSEQVSVNGAATPWSYADSQNGNPRPYTTIFTTGALSGSPATSTATVVWRPQFVVTNSNITFGAPSGSAYNGSYQIQINY
ncbi:MAG: hypothetical protein EKK45_17325 [Curvibacter sp.]|nr:MAG: hypothetical protein EKK45_17325 [Curvibacter sp.]